jgi:hypothetical protein
MDRDWTVSFSIRFRNGTCIIILDKKYNIANSSCHFGSYGSIWTGPSPKKYYVDLRSFGPYNFFFCDGPVHILPYDPQCHELFAIYQRTFSFSVLNFCFFVLLIIPLVFFNVIQDKYRMSIRTNIRKHSQLNKG